MKKLSSVAGLAAGLVVLGFSVSGWAKTEEGVLLRVVDARTGEPVGGAEVRFFDPEAAGTDRWLFGSSQLRSPRCERVDALGSHHRTDEQGELRLPSFSRVAYVSAAHEGLYDFERVRSNGQDPAVLKLVPDVTVKVRVLDPAGRPAADVPVALRRYGGASAGGIEMRSTGNQQPAVLVSSGPEYQTLGGVDTAGPSGIAEFRHVQEIVGEREEGERHVFAIGSLLAEPVEVELGGDGWPEEPLVLQLPETGEVEVLVVDVNGKPLLDPGLTVSLALAPEKPARKGRMGTNTTMSGAHQNTTAAPEGRALLRYVGVGVDLEVQGTREWLSLPLQVVGKGPRMGGERVTLTLACPVADHVLRGRLHDKKGSSFAGKEITCGVSWKSARVSVAGYTTIDADEHGGFAVVHGPGPDHDWDELLFEVRYTDRASREYVAANFTFTKEELMKPGVTDLGDIVLLPPAAIASGVVVDKGGKPVPDAFIMVEVQQFTGPAPADPTAERPFRWGGSSLNGMTDESGKFEILGVTDAEKVRLTCMGGGGRAERLVVSPGATGLRIVLPK